MIAREMIKNEDTNALVETMVRRFRCHHNYTPRQRAVSYGDLTVIKRKTCTKCGAKR